MLGNNSTGRQDLKICNFFYPLKLVAPAYLKGVELIIRLITYFIGANILHEMLLALSFAESESQKLSRYLVHTKHKETLILCNSAYKKHTQQQSRGTTETPTRQTDKNQKDLLRTAQYLGISMLDHFILPAHYKLLSMSFNPKNNCIYGEVF